MPIASVVSRPTSVPRGLPRPSGASGGPQVPPPSGQARSGSVVGQYNGPTAAQATASSRNTANGGWAPGTGPGSSSAPLAGQGGYGATLSPGQIAANQQAADAGKLLAGQQATNKGQFLWDSTLAGQVNDVNNAALWNSTKNQRDLNFNAKTRNGLDITQNNNNDNLLRSKLGLADNQYLADRVNQDSQWKIKGDQYASDRTNQDNQWNLRNGQYVADVDYINSTWGIDVKQQGQDQANSVARDQQLRRGYDFENQTYDQSLRKTALNEGTQNRAALSDATGRGAAMSQGFGDNMSDIRSQANLQREGATTNHLQNWDIISGNIRDLYHADDTRNNLFDQKGLSKDKNLGDSTRGYKGDISTMQNQRDSTDNNLQSDWANNLNNRTTTDNNHTGTVNELNNSLANNGLAGQALNSLAKDYGIKDTDLKQGLASAVKKNNLNLNQVISQLNQAYQSKDNLAISQMNQFIATLIGG